MKKEIFESLMSKSRMPNSCELEQISKIMKKESQKMNRITIFMLVVFSLGVILFFSSLMVNKEIIYLILEIFCLVGVISTALKRKKIAKITKAYTDGDFFICDGYASKIEATEEIVGCRNVMFTPNNGEDLSLGWYRVREENLCLKSPLLLVYLHPKYKDNRSYVYTDFMLSQNL